MRLPIHNFHFTISNIVVITTYHILHRTFSFLLFILFPLPFGLYGQYFNPGTDPASVRWNQVRSEHFRIIYPQGLDSQAVYIANAFEYFRQPGAASLDVLPGKWPVVLHNRTVVSNGFTPYAPKRIEFFMTPPQNNGENPAQNWVDQLIIHEYRHAVQYASVDRGFTRVLSFLTGQQALPAVLGLFVPWWFIEGDAVVTETASTKTGRGRLPAFEMKIRAQFLQKGIYSYDKAVNGSFKDYIPNHYELGYLLVGHARAEFGPETFSHIMRKTGTIPLMLVPFSNTLYKETGFGKSRLYGHISSNLEREWETNDQSRHHTEFEEILSAQDKFYTSRTNPSVLSDGRLVALKTSIDDIPRIVMIDTAGIEKVVAKPGPLTEVNLHALGNQIVWSEISYDPRWNYRTYSVIRTSDISKGGNKKITRRSRYFSPRLSPDGRKIAAVNISDNNQYSLILLDSQDGSMLSQFPVPENFFPDHPAWCPDGNKLAVVLTRNEGRCLAVADVVTGKFDILLPFSNTSVSKPCCSEDYIYFTGAYTGIENIFALRNSTNELFQVTSSRFGATDAALSADGTRLYYCDYQADGYQLVSIEINPENWEKTDPAIEFSWNLAEKLAEQENYHFDSHDVPDSAYLIKPYRKGLNLFNFHSWAPVSVDLNNMEPKPGIMLLSQNLLGTSTAVLGYSYDRNEETGKYYMNYTYEGLYPVLDLSLDYGLRRGVFKDTANHKDLSYKYNELNVSTGFRIPLSWTVRSWSVGLQPGAGYTLKFLKMTPDTDLKFPHDRINSLDSRLFMYAQSRQSARDLQPAWGQQIEVNYLAAPFDSDDINSIFAIEGYFYFPGLIRHQGIRVYAGYQQRTTYFYSYSSLIRSPRGFTGIYSDNSLSASIGYVAPLACPDWNAGPVFYLKRIKVGGFYDLMIDYDLSPVEIYQSVGVDLTMDFHLFRFFVPFETGLRTIYIPGENRFGFEFLYGFNIGELY